MKTYVGMVPDMMGFYTKANSEEEAKRKILELVLEYLTVDDVICWEDDNQTEEN